MKVSTAEGTEDIGYNVARLVKNSWILRYSVTDCKGVIPSGTFNGLNTPDNQKKGRIFHLSGLETIL